jgi:NADPH:quinone reductase-like Zn-dependent oxidoreductase
LDNHVARLLAEVPIPKPEAGWVLIEVRRSA